MAEPSGRAGGAADRADGAPRADVGVVALAMGGPARPEEVQPFLEALFSDPDLIQAPLGPLRRPFAKLVSRLRAPAARRRYGLMGGSPLVEETEKQVAALGAALAPEGIPVELALAYGAPDADAALAALAARGARRVLALPLYPQRSHATTGSSMRALERALARAQAAHPDLTVAEVPPYPTLPGLVEPLAASARQAAEEARAAGHQVALVLTAHGLPERYLRRGDPYVGHVEATAEAFRKAARLPVPMVLGFQSRIGPVRWVGPQVDEVVDRLVAGGTTALVVVPLTFVCEHLETRYDLDLELRRHAWEAGVRDYRRVPAIGSHPAFIAGLADLVRAAR